MKRLSGAVVLAVLLAQAGCSIKKPGDFVLPGGVATGSDGYEVSALFDNIENLVPNSRVLYNDVPIGTVTKIEMKDWRAHLTLNLKKNVPLAADATFRIGQSSLLGSEYVEVVAPHGRPASSASGLLTAGDTVTTTQTGNYPETEDVLSSVSLVLNGGGLAQLRTIATELNNMVGSPNRQENAREVIDRAHEFVESLDANKKNIVALIDSINELAIVLANDQRTVATAIRRIGPGLEVLDEERNELVKMLDQLSEFSTVATRVIDESGDDLVANLEQLQPVLVELEKASGFTADALMVVGTFPFPLPTIKGAVKGDFANFFPTLDLSLPQITANFIGGPADLSGFNDPGTQYQNYDPLRAAVARAAAAAKDSDEPTSSDSQPDNPAQGPTPPASVPKVVETPAPAPSPKPTKAPCNVLSQLLGGC